MSQPSVAANAADLARSKRVRQQRAPDKPDRLPPNSPEAEKGVLGCCLLSPRENIGLCVDSFKAEGAEFYDLRHMTIYSFLLKHWQENPNLDVITFQQFLKDNDVLEDVGGIGYLAQLPGEVPSAANLQYYLDIVCEKYVLRKIIALATEATGRIYEFQGDVAQLVEGIEKDFLSLISEREKTGFKDIRQLGNEALKEIQELAERAGQLSGIPTGFRDFDVLTSGLQPGDMIVLAARPSIGKTSLALNMVENIAVINKIPTGVFSIEMTGRSLFIRMIGSLGRVNLRMIREGFLAERDYSNIISSTTRIQAAPIYIDDSSTLTPLQLRARARRLVQQYGVKVIFVDYLQLMHMSGQRESRQQEVSDISRSVKSIAKELNIPIIVLSQLNRGVEKERNRRPKLSDLRESGSIEQDADVIGMLFKPLLPDEDDDRFYESDAIAITLDLAKQRNGPTGDIALTFLKSYTRFEPAARVSDADIPPDRRSNDDSLL